VVKLKKLTSWFSTFLLHSDLLVAQADIGAGFELLAPKLM
jgi:hypothetical protein